MSSIVEGFVAIVVMAIIMNGVVQIIKTAKSTGGKAQKEQLGELDSTMADLEEELVSLRGRVEVLEKIITDQKYQLDKEIRNLAG